MYRPMKYSTKVKQLHEFLPIREAARKEGKTVVVCQGHFDFLHPGHIMHLEEAKKQGDILLVAVRVDHLISKGAGRPVFNQDLRALCLAALSCVDYVMFDEIPDGPEFIRTVKPDIYAKGVDYKDDAATPGTPLYPTVEAIREIGGKMHITESEKLSSTDLLRTYCDLIRQEDRE